MLLGQDENPAVPPGLTFLKTPTLRIPTYADFFHGVPAPAHILKDTFLVPIALGSPFGFRFILQSHRLQLS